MALRFGTDGWRAAIGEEFTFAAVRRMACGIARYVVADPAREKRIIVGYDRRFASENFAEAAAATLAGQGLEVVLSDRALPTQICSFMARELGCLAMVVTASHNEWLDNGIKIKDVTGAPAAEEVLRAIEANIPDAPVPAPAGAGGISVVDFTTTYTQHVRKLVDVDLIAAAGGSFTVDPIHGCGAGWLPALLPHSDSLRLTEIRAERNPYFGGVNPEPILPHVAALGEAVLATGSDGGFAFDGDADRVGLVTESGRFVNQLQVFGLLYWHLLQHRELHWPAVYTITTTQMVPRLAAAFGTQAYETPVGFKYVGPKMQEVGAVIGGEESGGFGFGFHIPERDGLVAALLLLEMRAQRGVSFDELLGALQAEYGPSEYSRIDVRFARDGYDDVVRGTMQGIEGRIQAALADERPNRVVRYGDNGFKAFFDDGGWLLLRFSGTEPVLRIYSEAPSQERVDHLLARGRALAAG